MRIGDVAQALVGSNGVVERDVGLRDVIQMPEAGAEQVGETFPFEAPDPGLGVAVGDRRQVGRFDHARNAVGVPKVFVEGVGELGVPIVDEELQIDLLLLGPHENVARLLQHPVAGRMQRGWRGKHLAAFEVNEHQHVGQFRPERRPHLLAEKVTRDHRVHVRGHEGAPRCDHALGGMATGIRQETFIDQNTPDRTAAGRQRQIAQLTDDAPHAPADILSEIGRAHV